MSSVEPGRNGRGPGSPADAEGVSVAAALGAVIRRWKRVLGTAVVAMLVAGAVGAFRPRSYVAQTTLFMSQGAQSDPRAQLLAAQVPGLFAGLGGGGGNTRLIQAILGSRSLTDSLEKRFGPLGGAKVQSNADGSIRIEVTHRDPQVAARVANTYPVLLNGMVSRTGVESTRHKMRFLEAQLVSARSDLLRSEEAMVRFQRGRNAPQGEEQGQRTLDAAVQLQQRIAEKEIQLAQLRRTATPDNPQLRAAEAELRAWREQLRRLTTGQGGAGVLVPLRESAELRAQTSRLLRDYTAAEQVYVALTAAVAQARIDANNNLPVVTTIDPAAPPRSPKGPGVGLMVAMAGVLGALVGIVWAIAAAVAQSASRAPHNAPLFEAWDEVRGSRASASRSRTGVGG